MTPVQIKKIALTEKSHGDHLWLCFVSFHNLKTYAYLSLKQIEIIEKNFRVQFLKEVTDRPTWYTQKRAESEKFVLNIGLLFLLNEDKEWLLKVAKSKFNAFKKLPLAQLLLSDQPEVFHQHQTLYSYKNINHFRFSDFDKMKPNSMAIKIYNCRKLSELAVFLFGESNRVTNKLTLEVVLKVEKEDIQVDFQFIRFILMTREFLTPSEVIELISKHKEIKKSSFYKNEWYSYIFSGLDKNPMGMKLFFKNVKNFSNKKRLLLHWNIPSHIYDKFELVMEKAYPSFNLDLDKVSDVLYFYNNLSRDYGRLYVKDFKLSHFKKFENEVKILNNQETGTFTLKIPKNYHELVKWGSELCNCVGNFDQIPHYEEGLLVGVFCDNKLKYLIDYREKYGRKQITQLKGFKNSKAKSLQEIYEITKLFLNSSLVEKEDLKSLLED